MIRGMALSVVASLAVSTAWGDDVRTIKHLSIEDKARQYAEQYVREDTPPFPSDNPFSEEKSRLGKKLFFDARLSKSETQSCASCHAPNHGWEDALALGKGHHGKQLRRHTPTILDLAWAPLLFWDGRAESLEEQALGPIQSPDEMELSLDEMVTRLSADDAYVELFGAAFPGEGVSADGVAKAIATFERGVTSGENAFDRWVEGETDALSDSEKRGFVLFNEKANCAVCHAGWRLTDDGFHDIGVPSDDAGRAEVIPIEIFQHAFKTPTLRNIAERAPYLHDGSAATLEEVVRHYEDGFERRASLSPMMLAFSLNDRERADLVAFLHALSETQSAENTKSANLEQ